MNKIFMFALIGGIIIILVAFFYISIGLAYSGILRNVGFYVREGNNSFAQLHPDLAQYLTLRNLILGSTGLFAGIIAIIGGKISKVTGGILIVIASGISIVAFGILGIIPFALLLVSGVLALREKPELQQTTVTKLTQ
jgi:hypothetical protein